MTIEGGRRESMLLEDGVRFIRLATVDGVIIVCV